MFKAIQQILINSVFYNFLSNHVFNNFYKSWTNFVNHPSLFYLFLNPFQQHLQLISHLCNACTHNVTIQQLSCSLIKLHDMQFKAKTLSETSAESLSVLCVRFLYPIVSIFLSIICSISTISGR